MLDERFSAMRTALKEPPSRRLRRGASGDRYCVAQGGSVGRPGSYRAQLALGAALAKQGDKAAFEPLEKAAALVPMATGDESPHAIMGRLAEQLGDPAARDQGVSRAPRHDHNAIEAARRLAELASEGERRERSSPSRTIGSSSSIRSTRGPHRPRTDCACKSKRATVAMREFRWRSPSDRPTAPSAHCNLAESYLLAGKPADAKREALAALEIAPSFERAQELLLKAIDGGQAPSSKDGSRAAMTTRRRSLARLAAVVGAAGGAFWLVTGMDAGAQSHDARR